MRQQANRRSVRNKCLISALVFGLSSGAWPSEAGNPETPSRQPGIEGLPFPVLDTKARQGNAEAQFELGLRLGRGQGLPVDDQDALKWIKLSAEQGYAPAQCNLGYRLLQASAPDRKEAANWFRKAADQGYIEAQHQMGLSYSFGCGVPKDLAMAGAWFRKIHDHFLGLAKQGDTNAQWHLGQIYTDGEGVERNPEEAMRWFRRGAEQGSLPAQIRLAGGYAHGIGVREDIAEAIHWYRISAQKGDLYAQGELGTCCMRSNDFEAAYIWFSLAAAGPKREPLDFHEGREDVIHEFGGNPAYHRKEASKQLSQEALQRAQAEAERIHKIIQATANE